MVKIPDGFWIERHASRLGCPNIVTDICHVRWCCMRHIWCACDEPMDNHGYFYKCPFQVGNFKFGQEPAGHMSAGFDDDVLTLSKLLGRQWMALR